MDRSRCESFLANDGSDDLIVKYDWDGESIGLELGRLKAAQPMKTIYWGADATLGVTFGVEETSRRIIVTRTTRTDVQPGDVLIQAMGERVTEANLDEMMVRLKRAHAISPGIPFEFAPPPPRVYVKSCLGSLKQAGVDASFELRYVENLSVRYLTLEELQGLIRCVPKPCSMIFVQSKEQMQQLAALRRQNSETDAAKAVTLAGLAAAVAVSFS